MIAKDGKSRLTDVVNAKDLLRLVQSIPSKKAEPFKMWLAQVGSERLDEIADPEKAIVRGADFYRAKGYTEGWINQRLQTIEMRIELTDEWKNHGITKEKDYAILSNEMTKAWSGMSVKEYKQLNALGYRKHRENPLKAYEDCGIEIYDKENEALDNIQTNPRNLEVSSKLKNTCPEIEMKVSEIGDEEKIRRDFFNKLAEYFKINYSDFVVKYKNNCEHFDIRKTSDLSFNKIMVNARVVNGYLKDICVFFPSADAKNIYERLYFQKNEIENQIGYELVWDINYNKIATRIGRFGKYYRKTGSCRVNDLLYNTTSYDFDLDVEKVTNELVNIYNVFMPRVKSILVDL